MLNIFCSKCIKMEKRCAFGTSYGITYFNSGITVRPSLGKACINLCHVFGLVISTPGQGIQLLAGLLKKMVRRSTSSKGVKGCTSYVMISPVVVVKYEILYSLYHCEDVPCTHESLNVDIKRVRRASLPPLERHSSRQDERKKNERNTSV